MAEELKAWEPCVERDLVCDGEYHRGWDGHDAYIAKCPRPKPPEEVFAHKLLGEFCACYGEAWPARTCATEAKKLADWLALNTRPAPTQEMREAVDQLLLEHIGAQMYDRQGNAIVWSSTSTVDAILILIGGREDGR